MEIGSTFKQIRQAKHLTLNALADGNASASFIGKFEKGLTNMSISRFINLLDKMHVSQAEFEFIHGTNTGSYISERIKLLEEKSLSAEHLQTFIARIKTDIAAQPNDNAPKFLLLWAEALLPLISNTAQTQRQFPADDLAMAVRPIQNYLLSVETWGIYELQLFTLASFMLPKDILFQLAKLAVKRVQGYEASFLAMQTKLMDIIWTVFSTLVYEDLNYANEILHIAEMHLAKHPDITQKIMLTFNQGWYEIEAGNHAKGLRLANLAIVIYTSLGFKTEAADLQSRLDHHIQRQGFKTEASYLGGDRIISINL
jgi:Rgg/GadR/MutR family transcriptional activator